MFKIIVYIMNLISTNMGFLKKLMNPLTKGQQKDDALEENKRALQQVKYLNYKISSGAESLYCLRKQAVKSIQQLQDFTESLPNCPDVLIQGSRRAFSYTSAIREAAMWEDSQFDNSNRSALKNEKKTTSAVAGTTAAVAGGLTATLGPSAAMAIATTFGTASTGAAIGTLGGAAATNAALAWLGGGAIAAGGAGMAGGSALLAALGPIGWSVAGVSIVTSLALSRSRNSKDIDNIKKNTEELYRQRDKFSEWNRQLTELIKKTSSLTDQVSISGFSHSKKDFAHEDFPKEELFEVISKAKLLGKISNEAICIAQ